MLGHKPRASVCSVFLLSVDRYAAETFTRQERVKASKVSINQAFADYKQQEFIEFILSKYVQDGVGELATSKMRSLIELKYNYQRCRSRVWLASDYSRDVYGVSEASVRAGTVVARRDTTFGWQFAAVLYLT